MDKVASPRTKATHQLTKQHNRELVLKTIFDHETISRASIARLTQLTRTTVSEVISGLVAERLVEEVGPGSSTGGKPSILLRLVADSRYLIGVNLAQNRFTASVLNLRGDIKKTVEVSLRGEDAREAILLVYKILDPLVREQWNPIVGIGVGTPGLINTRAGIVVNAVNLDWQELPLGHLLEKRYGLPVRLLNDSQAAAIGEFVHGDHASNDNLIVINVSHGIGAGILIHGRLFQGDGGGAGEIGHIQILAGKAQDGWVCRCGRQGCLETQASGRAILQSVRQVPGLTGVDSLDAIETKFHADDPPIREIILAAGRSLGIAIGGLVGTLNIRNIIVTGDVTRFGARWLDAVRGGMHSAALERMVHDTQLEIGKLDYRACILGASAYLLFDDFSLLFLQKEN
jgi:predicted NBD/HSP70 family sugar kinase